MSIVKLILQPFFFQQTKTFDYEHSEMLLYQNEIMIDGEMYKEALDHLKEFERQITDKITVLETKGICLITVILLYFTLLTLWSQKMLSIVEITRRSKS